MNLHPIVRADADDEGREASGSNGKNPITLPSQNDISKLTKTLAAVGGGSLSADLALDLILNQVVEQARTATQASGAAVALERDGEIICRAMSGNAPDLGVRVETRGGLSGACLQRAEVQHCSDTDRDLRVNAEACHRLNVRSILMVPILDGDRPFGILEIFGAVPHAFSDNDVKTLQLLAKRVSESKDASLQTLGSDPVPAVVEKPAETASTDPIPAPLETVVPQPVLEPAVVLPEQAQREPQPNYNEILTSVLVVLVITAAILLGLVVGVRIAVQRSLGKPPAQNAPAAAKNVTPEAPKPAKVKEPAPSQSGVRTVAPPAGGLVITDRGKIVYRSDPANPDSEPASSPQGLVHRVEPSYPESAKAQHLQGNVVLDAQVLGDGSVGNISIVRGHPLLVEAATQAVKQWKFEPSTVDGKPVNREERITVRFTLPAS
jgi:TonB family protein